ncbi:hypothetical protein VCR15J2_390019 [Vibrio coralliirubri]|nr:hypothetical protein VCR15J2_390019 [Vibrio coralliirubri]
MTYFYVTRIVVQIRIVQENVNVNRKTLETPAIKGLRPDLFVILSSLLYISS